ncbi:MAG: hypothetical protein JO129_02560 [Candidatus Dependentiae bacterium]|nr:hypothetical protein [Candidatus Dependentiae bacterium]
MKKINILFIILLSCLPIDSCDQNKDHFVPIQSTSSESLLVEQFVHCIKKHAVPISLIPIISYYHQDIFQFMSHRPYLSSVCFYLCLNYACDSLISYRQQQSLLTAITLLKKISLYLVISHGIKNHIHQKKLSIEPAVDDQSFLNNITRNLPYSFDEITLIVIKSYPELKSHLQSLNMMLNIESEEFVFLCHASSIDLQSLLYLVQNDSILFQAIYQFEKNPQNHLGPLLEHLTAEITRSFVDLEKHLLKLNIHAHILS